MLIDFSSALQKVIMIESCLQMSYFLLGNVFLFRLKETTGPLSRCNGLECLSHTLAGSYQLFYVPFLRYSNPMWSNLSKVCI